MGMLYNLLLKLVNCLCSLKQKLKAFRKENKLYIIASQMGSRFGKTGLGFRKTLPSLQKKKKRLTLVLSNSHSAMGYFMATASFQSKMIRILALPIAKQHWPNDKRAF